MNISSLIIITTLRTNYQVSIQMSDELANWHTPADNNTNVEIRNEQYWFPTRVFETLKALTNGNLNFSFLYFKTKHSHRKNRWYVSSTTFVHMNSVPKY